MFNFQLIENGTKAFFIICTLYCSGGVFAVSNFIVCVLSCFSHVVFELASNVVFELAS